MTLNIEDFEVQPDSSPLSLANIVAQGNALRTYLGSMGQQVAGEKDAAYAASQKVLDATGRGFDARGNTPETIEAARAAQMRSQGAAANFAKAAGTDASIADSLAVKLGAQAQQKLQEAIALDKIVGEKEGVGFFDNPMKYLMNQLTVDGDVAKYNAAASQFNKMTAGLSELQSMTQSQSATQKSIEQTVTAASAAAEAAASKADIEARSAEVDRLMHLSNASALVEIANMTVKEYEVAAGIQSKLSDEEHWKVSVGFQREAADRARATAARLASGGDSKTEKDSADSMLVAAYQAGYKKLHGTLPPPISIADLKFFYNSRDKKGVGATTQKYVEEGLVIIANPNAPGRDNIGTDPADTAGKVLNMQVQLSPQEKQVFDNFVLPAMQDVLSDPKTKPGTADALVNEKTEIALAPYRKNVAKDSANNPFSAVATSNVPTILPAVAKTPWWKTVIAPQAAVAEGGNLSYQKVIDYTRAAVREKIITAAQAEAGIKAWADGSIAHNNRTKFKRIGVRPQGALPVTVERTKSLAFGGEKKVYDLRNPTHIKELLLK